MRLLVVSVLVSCVAATALAQNAPAAPPADLDAWVARAMAGFRTPGVAVAVVKDGRVLFSKGFGVRRLGSPEKVDEDTLFGIASNTKAFTAAALAMLVDEGKIKWDDRVIDHLPGFRMSDPYVTREITGRSGQNSRNRVGRLVGRRARAEHARGSRDLVSLPIDFDESCRYSAISPFARPQSSWSAARWSTT